MINFYMVERKTDGRWWTDWTDNDELIVSTETCYLRDFLLRSIADHDVYARMLFHCHFTAELACVRWFKHHANVLELFIPSRDRGMYMYARMNVVSIRSLVGVICNIHERFGHLNDIDIPEIIYDHTVDTVDARAYTIDNLSHEGYDNKDFYNTKPSKFRTIYDTVDTDSYLLGDMDIYRIYGIMNSVRVGNIDDSEVLDTDRWWIHNVLDIQREED